MTQLEFDKEVDILNRATMILAKQVSLTNAAEVQNTAYKLACEEFEHDHSFHTNTAGVPPPDPPPPPVGN